MSTMNPTLRERLQARRERIAAGLPPPAPITVNTGFFASSITSTKTRTCTECGTAFAPHGKQVVCGPDCYDKRVSRMRAVEPYTLTCEECHQPFTSNDPRSVVCGDECRAERRRRYKREWAREHREEVAS